MNSVTLRSFAEAKGWKLKKWNVILEGQSDVDILQLAVALELAVSQKNYSDNFAFLASGIKNEGGVNGVWRELPFFHKLSMEDLDATGKRTHRFIGLLDNDYAARQNLRILCEIHCFCEYREIFLLHPVMPSEGNLDPATLKTTIAKKNVKYGKMAWEIEDYFPLSFWNAFLSDHPEALKSNGRNLVEDMVHYELTDDGKANFLRYVKRHAIHSDFCNVIQMIKALRFFMNAPLVPCTT